jgi:hypothetical protein
MSTGSLLNMSDVAVAPGVIVGHVPLTAGSIVGVLPPDPPPLEAAESSAFVPASSSAVPESEEAMPEPEAVPDEELELAPPLELELSSCESSPPPVLPPPPRVPLLLAPLPLPPLLPTGLVEPKVGEPAVLPLLAHAASAMHVSHHAAQELRRPAIMPLHLGLATPAAGGHRRRRCR